MQHGNWTYQDFLPFSNGSVTERGLWSVSRGGLPALQNSSFTINDTVWLLYTNENATKTHGGSCSSSDGIAGPYQSTQVVRNLFYPFENYTLGASDRPFYYDGKEPFFGCIESITMQPYDFKALVPLAAGSCPPLRLPDLLLDMTPGSKWPPTIRTPTASTSRLSFRI